jgi:hypothetical protein
MVSGTMCRKVVKENEVSNALPLTRRNFLLSTLTVYSLVDQ